LGEPEVLRSIVRRYRPNVVINAAAHTAVDRAETEPDIAHTINAVAPGVLAQEARSIGACFVHYSTDYVFDGRQSAPYRETDLTNPLSVYGRSKLAGEVAVSRAGGRHLLFRTSWVVSSHGRNFVKTILGLATTRRDLRVVADQHGAPTTARLVAQVTAHALRSMMDATEIDDRWGVYHLTAAGETTWYELARHVIRRARELGVPLKASPDSVTPVTSAEYPTPAKRPANSRLDTAKLRRVFAVPLPDWKLGVDEVLEQLRTEQGVAAS